MTSESITGRLSKLLPPVDSDETRQNRTLRYTSARRRVALARALIQAIGCLTDPGNRSLCPYRVFAVLRFVYLLNGTRDRQRA